MKKVMFMFAAAAMFAACGNTQKPAEVVEEQVEEAVVVDTTLNAADTAAVLAALGVATVEEANADSLQVKLDACLAAKFEAFEKAQAEAAAAVEETVTEEAPAEAPAQ